jgi:ComF family protein
LARALAAGLPARALSADAILVPVPISRASLRRRGFNQAERLANSLSALTKIPVETHALVKTRATAPQSTLDRAARVHNVAGAMAVVARERIAGRRVVLVDDLVTTGATAAACASALWEAGAAEVRVVCVGYRP